MRCSTFPDLDPYAAARAQGDRRKRRHGPIWLPFDGEALHHGRRHQNCFQHSEALADADARAAAERHVSEAGQLACKISHPALGTERFRLAEVTRITVQDPRTNEDGRSLLEKSSRQV